MRIAFIGSGKVAHTLAHVFHQNGICISGIYSRNQITGKALAKALDSHFYSDLQSLSADLFIVATNDASVSDLQHHFTEKQWVVYTAGAVPLSDFSGHNWGVFYPLQSFSEDRILNSADIPILLETTSNELQQLLEVLCKQVGFPFQQCDSITRKKYHLAAVFINNFVNHLVYKAQSQLEKEGLDWRILQALLNETIAKLDVLSAFESQTGPARRKDEKTMELHRQMLRDMDREIYDVLTKSILKTYSTHDKL